MLHRHALYIGNDSVVVNDKREKRWMNVVKGKNCLHAREVCKGNVDVALSIVNPRLGMINPQLTNSMLRLILLIDQLNAQILVL